MLDSCAHRISRAADERGLIASLLYFNVSHVGWPCAAWRPVPAFET
jgi:hypothetical protein